MTNLSDTLAALKPCPFCGHQRRYIHADAPCGDRRYWTVICEGCEAHGPPFSECSGGEAEAIAAWNTRTGQLVPVPSATLCIGCEGKPAPENNPCAVCGATTQQLVPVPSVERVAFQIWHQLGQIEENVRAGTLTQDEVRTIATAVIAAMQEGAHDRP